MLEINIKTRNTYEEFGKIQIDKSSISKLQEVSIDHELNFILETVFNFLIVYGFNQETIQEQMLDFLQGMIGD